MKPELNYKKAVKRIYWGKGQNLNIVSLHLIHATFLKTKKFLIKKFLNVRKKKEIILYDNSL